MLTAFACGVFVGVAGTIFGGIAALALVVWLIYLQHVRAATDRRFLD